MKRLNHGSLSHSLQSGGEQDEGKKKFDKKGKDSTRRAKRCPTVKESEAEASLVSEKPIPEPATEEMENSHDLGCW